MPTRRTVLAALSAVAPMLLLHRPALAQAPDKPFVLYDDELKNGWVNWSWAKVQLGVAIGGAKPIKVEGDPWTALLLHHEPFSTSGFSKLTFAINGGVSGGQQLAIKAMIDGKAVEQTFMIEPKAKTWNRVEIPLAKLGIEGKTIDGISWQGQADPYSAYYITRIQFE
ncbi:MAG: hypothetical protein ABW202_03210 [Duganella sp.]